MPAPTFLSYSASFVVRAAFAAAPDIDVLARIYRAGRLLRIAYEAELEAALRGCGAGQ